MEKVFGAVFTSESDWQLYRAVGGSSAVPDAEGAALFQKTGLRALAAGVPEFLCADRAAKSFQSDSFQGGNHRSESGEPKL